MMVPAVHGLATDDGASARGFGYGGPPDLRSLVAMIGARDLGINRVRQPIRGEPRSPILAFYAVPAGAAGLADDPPPWEGALSLWRRGVRHGFSTITTTGAPSPAS